MEIDIMKFLMREIRIVMRKGKYVRVDFKYERLFNFCYIYGRLSYVDRDCIREDDIERDDIVFRYGEWLCVSLRR